MQELWLNKETFVLEEISEFKRSCKETLTVFDTEEWRTEVNNCRKCYLYKAYKLELKLEDYLCNIDTDKLKVVLTRFRLCNHRLSLEIGSYNNLERKFRLCPHCDQNDIGDEFHYMFTCSKFKSERVKFIHRKCIQYCSVAELMSSKSKNMLLKLAYL